MEAFGLSRANNGFKTPGLSQNAFIGILQQPRYFYAVASAFIGILQQPQYFYYDKESFFYFVP